ncbi:hypothetical protein SAMN04487936_101459 [Halobacillus dabanensis]|uniref:Uncharacterized protein n=1 Tax=Halobacillus dabanensis TaxID=240302 RepID=A0A1I3PW18_HALDA|nr:hypothetical protein SAMN04487936_101459 [Halobacillus dabanensis]
MIWIESITTGMAHTFQVTGTTTDMAPMSRDTGITMAKEHMLRAMGFNMDIAPMHQATVIIMVTEGILHGTEEASIMAMEDSTDNNPLNLY